LLAKEWHPRKNLPLTPENVLPNTHKAVWWLCKDCNNNWKASIKNRHRQNQGCPFCSGRYATSESNLFQLHPQLSAEWHPTKNEDLTPYDVKAKSSKVVWWICNRKHEWKARISSRTLQESSCPYCFSSTSKLELRIYSELKYLFEEVTHRKKVMGYECDIYLQQCNLGIELDSFYYHKGERKYAFDKNKNKMLKQRGLTVVRLREKGLKKLSSYDINFTQGKDVYTIICELLRKIESLIKPPTIIKSKIKRYLRGNKLKNDKFYRELLFMLPSPPPENSLAQKYPELIKEWDLSKNRSLFPEHVTPGSEMKVWWTCKTCAQSWIATVNSRVRGNGCPYCSGKKASEDNCLQTKNPALANEWHTTQNGNLSPKDVTPNSGKKVWWICKKKGHEWPAVISSRNKGTGCPYCSGRYATKENNLQKVNPKLAKEWHPTKNGHLTPKDILPNSGKKAWWICKKKGHEWEAIVSNRNRRGDGCPYCSGRRK
jgi:hypothetical protein